MDARTGQSAGYTTLLLIVVAEVTFIAVVALQPHVGGMQHQHLHSPDSSELKLPRNISYQPPSDIPVILQPHASITVTAGSRTEDGYIDIPDYSVRTNGKGFREEPFQADSPPHQHRIIVVGDSFAFGWGVNRTDRFTDIAERQLQEQFPGRNVTMLNLAIPGFGLRDYTAMVEERASRYRPDLLVVSFSRGDAVSLSARREIRRHIRKSTNTTLPEKDRIARFKAEVRQRRQNRTWVHQEFDNAMHAMRNSTGHGTSILFYAYRPLPEQPRRTIERTARKYNISFVSAPAAFDRRPPQQYTIPDDGHYNAVGQRLLADRLSTVLAAHLNESTSR